MELRPDSDVIHTCLPLRSPVVKAVPAINTLMWADPHSKQKVLESSGGEMFNLFFQAGTTLDSS